MTHLDPFLYTLRVRYQECDAQKVVFNARYSDYVDIAVYEFTRAIGYGDQMMSGAIDYQLVKQTIEWKAPARFDQVLALWVYPVHLGNTSFTLRTEFRIYQQEPMIASAETVYVCVQAHGAGLVKMPLPPHFRTALQKAARGMWVDHAGCGDVLK
jgi:acyl-CoA thioester hydrolase